MFSGADDTGTAAPNAVRRNPVGMCRQARGTASAGRAAKIPPFFLLPRKTLWERTADAGRSDDAMRLGQKSVFSFRNDVSCTADGHTWPGTDMGYNLRPPCLLLRQECTPAFIYPIYSLKTFKAYGSSLYRRKGLAGLRRKIGNAGRTGPAAGTPVRAEDGQQLNRLAGRMSCAGSQQADAAILSGKGTDSVLQRRRKVFLPGKRRRGVSRIENRT